jgi:hypothetical protein
MQDLPRGGEWGKTCNRNLREVDDCPGQSGGRPNVHCLCRRRGSSLVCGKSMAPLLAANDRVREAALRVVTRALNVHKPAEVPRLQIQTRDPAATALPEKLIGTSSGVFLPVAHVCLGWKVGQILRADPSTHRHCVDVYKIPSTNTVLVGVE